ncbi:uncharacterized protein LOC125493574 [Beta vulgaris subsp. vulgaris]|uniref:uncharacterized protein LOC125493574 n=1 Tax=Beta vulgaris subsp. vulgaris TaxID=3555 RepID=UPI002036AF0A|nr:uncharacterized protein LOC125493574 [Beta vulgaris subsp. vulgaris]
MKSERAQEFTLTLWSIWIHRNNIVFRNQNYTATAIYQRIEALRHEYAESRRLRGTYHRSSQTSPNVQEPLQHQNNSHPESTCIILVDGAWKRYKNQHPRAGIGWVASVNNVKIFGGKAIILALTPLQTEAYALFQSMQEAHTKGITQVAFKSDCAELVRAIESQHQAYEITTIIQDIRTIRHKFISCDIVKVNRTEVEPAHELARAARQGNLGS